MQRSAAICCVLALLLAGASAARFTPSTVSSGSGVAGLKTTAQGLLTLLRGPNVARRSKDKDRDDDDDAGLRNRMMAIRFEVPPSVSEEFEKQWMKMEDQEDEADILTLKYSKLNNLFYYSYGEWPEHSDLHNHLTSDHFSDFAEFCDDKGIEWELELLNDMSSDMEGDEDDDDEDDDDHRKVTSKHKKHNDDDDDDDSKSKKRRDDDEPDDWIDNVPEDQRHWIPDKYRPDKEKHRKHKHKKVDEVSKAARATLGEQATPEQIKGLRSQLSKQKDNAHILITYKVDPSDADNFVEQWVKAAEQTVEEKGNQIYSLRKVATDNTHWYTYGTWDSMSDYLDHLESKHVSKLLEYFDDEDIIYFIQPLKAVE